MNNSRESALQRKADIDYIVQSLSEIDGFLKGIRILAKQGDSNQFPDRDLYEMGVKVRCVMQKAINIWQEYDLEGYNTFEQLAKKIEQQVVLEVKDK